MLSGDQQNVNGSLRSQDSIRRVRLDFVDIRRATSIGSSPPQSDGHLPADEFLSPNTPADAAASYGGCRKPCKRVIIFARTKFIPLTGLAGTVVALTGRCPVLLNYAHKVLSTAPIELLT